MEVFKIITMEEALILLNQYYWIELHLHHTWKPDHSNFNGSNHMALQQGMYNYHVITNKWDNIAQHLTLFPDGKWVTGRPLSEMPISMKGQNKVGALAVEMIGNFDAGCDVLQGKQKEAILTIIKYFLNKGKAIKFHNEYSEKTCPGTSINKLKLLQEARELDTELETPSVPVQIVSGFAKDAHKWTTENKISDGTRPKDTLTREEMWTMLYRAYQLLK